MWVPKFRFSYVNLTSPALQPGVDLLSLVSCIEHNPLLKGNITYLDSYLVGITGDSAWIGRSRSRRLPWEDAAGDAGGSLPAGVKRGVAAPDDILSDT
jgi:hypothetical protein